jgi:hypothetical protein
VTRPGAGAIALAAVFTLGACGTTYVDTSVTVPATGPTSTTTLPPVAADTPIETLFTEIGDRLEHLDERIIDRDDAVATMARIDELWVAAEAQIRERDPDLLFPFEQAIDLARSGVTRNRPADASKAYKILVTAIAAYT